MGADGVVLVTGATGTVGRELVGRLLLAGQRVRAGVRDPSSANLPADVDVIHLDFADPSSAAPAVKGVDRIFLMRPPAISNVRTALGPLVTAAARTGVRRVVVLSVMGVNPALPHWRMEKMVTAAGLEMTALRPAYFSQNLITAFGRDIRERSQLRLASGDGRVSFVDTRDVAAVAATVFADLQAWPPQPLTLTGPQALTFTDAAAILGAELGRPVRYLRQSFWQRRAALLAQGMESGYVTVQLVIDLTTRLGLARRMTQEIPRILGRPATTLAEFVHDHRDAWIQQP